MSTLVATVIITLATIRATRLVTTDKITEPARRWVINHNGEQGWFTFLVHCPWCTGYWVALPATAILWWYTDLPTYAAMPAWVGIPAAWSALAYITGYTLTNLEEH